MGQYYKAVSLDQEEYLRTQGVDVNGFLGMKLLEHSYVGNAFTAAVENLLSPKGNWHKTRIVWAGDYMDCGLFIPEEHLDEVLMYDDGEEITGSDITLYHYSNKHFKKLYMSTTEEYGRYIINHTRETYVDKEHLEGFEVGLANGETDIWHIHPLPLLTCSGNGRGGGDYNGINMSQVGNWAGDVISVEKEKPEGYSELEVSFIEEHDLQHREKGGE